MVDSFQVGDPALELKQFFIELLLLGPELLTVSHIVIRDGLLQLIGMLLELQFVLLELLELFQILVDPILIVFLLLLHEGVDGVELASEPRVLRLPISHSKSEQ